jgi:hypothetical protein
MKNFKAAWPDDLDGDVLRRMQIKGFDFAKAVDIDFNVDFDTWPPAEGFVSILGSRYSQMKLYPLAFGDGGYILLGINAVLTYELVVSEQKTLSELAAPFGGICESWGVLH